MRYLPQIAMRWSLLLDPVMVSIVSDGYTPSDSSSRTLVERTLERRSVVEFWLETETYLIAIGYIAMYMVMT